MRNNSALVLLLVLLTSSLITIESASAQSIPKPSVPEFTVNLADHSYDVPSRTFQTTDPYNNKTTTINYPSSHVKNFSIEITIANQPFPPTIKGNTSILYYNLQQKPHFGQEWAQRYNQNTSIGTLTPQSNSGFTVISFLIDPANFEVGNQIDYQVEAILAYQYTSYEYLEHLDPWYHGPYPVPVNHTVFVESSGWSPTQTFTMPNTSTSQSSTPLTSMIIIPLAAVVILIIALSIVFLLRHRNRDPCQSEHFV
jgi:hypothetical protein